MSVNRLRRQSLALDLNMKVATFHLQFRALWINLDHRRSLRDETILFQSNLSRLDSRPNCFILLPQVVILLMNTCLCGTALDRDFLRQVLILCCLLLLLL